MWDLGVVALPWTDCEVFSKKRAHDVCGGGVTYLAIVA
jgi:hypothetical protein